MYAHNVHRDDYQDLARDMLGLPAIAQERRQGAGPPRPRRRHRHRLRPGRPSARDAQGRRARTPSRATSTSPTPTRRPSTSRTAASTSSSRPTPGVNGGRGPRRGRRAGRRAGGHRLFGFFGTKDVQPPPLPDRRRRLRPRRRDLDGKAETYTPADLDENPTLADMTRAALTVLARQARPAVRPLRRGRRRRLRPPRQQPRQRHRRRLQRRGRRPGDHRLGREEQQLGRLGPDRHRRPRPLPRPRRPRGPRRQQAKP